MVLVGANKKKLPVEQGCVVGFVFDELIAESNLYVSLYIWLNWTWNGRKWNRCG